MFFPALSILAILFAAVAALPGTPIQARNSQVSATGQPAAAAWRPGVPPLSAQVMYTGDGSSNHGWPSRENWTAFEDMWSINQANIKQGCGQFGVDLNTDDEIQQLHDAILTVSGESHVDSRFILAIVLQESQGCVRAPTTGNGVRNPGIMQSHNGASCNDETIKSPDGKRTLSPCPKITILDMIWDGTSGTADGDGLAACINQQQVGSVDDDATQSYFRAARQYNSGSIKFVDNLNSANGATECYVLDVANRVVGWVGSDNFNIQCNPHRDTQP